MTRSAAFFALVSLMLSIIDAVMYLPGSWLQRIDR